MIYQHRCEYCGKYFASHRWASIYCCKECKQKAHRKRIEDKSQPCWVCTKACGGCFWSKYLVPIEGWKAVEHIVHEKKNGGDFRTYRILYCPEFNHE